jgi:hypothetical protein
MIAYMRNAPYADIQAIPRPSEEQTLPSVAAQVWIANGYPGWFETVRRVFHGSNRFERQRALHEGFIHSFEVLNGLGYFSVQEMLAHHSYLPFLDAFSSTEALGMVREMLCADNFGRLNALPGIGLRNLLDPNAKYCPECAKQDLLNDGVVHAMRVHQFLWLDCCPHHGCRLGYCWDGQRGSSPARYGIASESEVRNVLLPSVLNKVEKSPTQLLGRWAIAAFDGQLAGCTRRARLASLNYGAARRFGNARNFSRTLHELLTHTYGREFLQKIGMSVTSGPMRYWPELLLSGSAYLDNPLANLLVISILFSSPNEYRVIQRECELVRSDRSCAEQYRQRGGVRVTLGLSLAKSLLTEKSLRSIAREQNLDEGTVASLLDTFPRIRERRSFSIVRARKRRMRRTLVRFLETSAPRTRQSFRAYDSAAACWLKKNDREWYDHHLAPAVAGRPLGSRSCHSDTHRASGG